MEVIIKKGMSDYVRKDGKSNASLLKEELIKDGYKEVAIMDLRTAEFKKFKKENEKKYSKLVIIRPFNNSTNHRSRYPQAYNYSFLIK